MVWTVWQGTQNGVLSSNPFTLTALPRAGQWKAYELSFTTPAGGEFVGKPVSVVFHVDVGAHQPFEANWDIVAAPVPGPIAGAWPFRPDLGWRR
jgi:hypothetical protein